MNQKMPQSDRLGKAIEFFRKRFFEKSTHYQLIICLLLIVIGTLNAQEPQLWKEPPKKLIHIGWCSPNTKTMHQNAETITKALRAYDGLLIKLHAEGIRNDKAVTIPGKYFLDNFKWKWEWLQPALIDVKATDFKQLKYNFIHTMFNGGISWFDDEAWGNVCNNFGLIARFCKEAGFVGFAIDTEDYSYIGTGYESVMLFNSKISSGHSYAETYIKTRERGKQWIEAIQKEFPNIKILPYFWFSALNGTLSAGLDPYQAGKTEYYGMLLPFINGVYDGIKGKAIIIDGWEKAYRYATSDDYYRGQALYYKNSKRLISPENIDKMRKHSQLGMSIYLNAYLSKNPNAADYEILKRNPGETPLEILTNNVRNALTATDEYVWTWDERKWWPTAMVKWQENAMEKGYSKNQHEWEKALPGITEAMIKGKMGKKDEELTNARDKIKGYQLKNLCRNSSFTITGKNNETEKLPPDCVLSTIPNWLFWQDKVSKGKAYISKDGFADQSCVALKNINGSGCLLQPNSVLPGEQYYVAAKMKNVGFGTPTFSVQWQNNKGAWCSRSSNVYSIFNQDMGNKWKKTECVVTVPKEANIIVILPGVRYQFNVNDVIYFDDFELYSLSKNTKKTILLQ